jgi:hypothetical protein
MLEMAPLGGRLGAKGAHRPPAGGSSASIGDQAALHLNTAFDHGSPAGQGEDDDGEDEDGGGALQSDAGVPPQVAALQAKLDKAVAAGMVLGCGLNVALLVYVW